MKIAIDVIDVTFLIKFELPSVVALAELVEDCKPIKAMDKFKLLISNKINEEYISISVKTGPGQQGLAKNISELLVNNGYDFVCVDELFVNDNSWFSNPDGAPNTKSWVLDKIFDENRSLFIVDAI